MAEDDFDAGREAGVGSCPAVCEVEAAGGADAENQVCTPLWPLHAPDFFAAFV